MKKILISTLCICAVFVCTYLFSLFYIKIALPPLMTENIDKFVYLSNFIMFMNYINTGFLGFLGSTYFIKRKSFKHSVLIIAATSLTTFIINSFIDRSTGITETLFGLLVAITVASIGYLIGHTLALIIFSIIKSDKQR